LNKACGLIPNGDDNQPVEVARIEESGAALIATGCRSPLVDLYYGRILLWQDRIALAGVHLNRARERLDSDYPAINHFFLLEALAAVTLKQKRPLESQRLSKLGLSYLAKAVITGEFQPDEIPMIYRLIDAGDGQAFENKSFGQFYEYIKKEKTIDPWLPAIIKGRHEIHLAMQIRGKGEASAVPDMDWEGFQRHLIKARMQLTKAWILKPEYPEASALMIPVTNRGFGNPGETAKLWFYRAVNAQMDYLPAYDMLMTSLRPMWGGSHEKLLRFGEECLATGRYDTWVPMVYLKAVRMVGSELKNCNWRAPFRIPKVNKNLERLFEQALAAPAHQGMRDNILIQRALTKAWCGHWMEARNELIANKSRPDLTRGFCGEPLSWNNRGWEEIYAELTAFTGSQQRLLIRAEALQMENQTQKALALFKRVINTLPEKKEIQRYLWNRIAEIMLEVPSQKIQGPLLHMAAAMGRGDVVQLLLDQGTAIQERDRNGSTALHYAAQHGRTQMVAMLLDHGADIDSGDRLERTPLVVALANGHPEVAKFLLGRNADSGLVTSEGFTPFHYAVRGEDQEVFQLLLSKGADINAINMYQVTPLHMALYEGKSAAARFVIANGGRLDQPDNHQWSPLHLAVVNEMPEIAIQMIEAGADINIPMERNWTPLHLAAHYGQEFVVRLLLEKGADPMAQLHDGDTPLEIARKSRNHRIEKLLLEFKPGSI
jgi:ankyrin repeat protein